MGNYATMASAAIAQGDLETAKRRVNLARSFARAAGESPETALANVAASLDAAARNALRDADADFAAGRYLEAIKQYQRIAVTMSGLGVADEAHERVRAAQNDPAVKAAMREAQAESIRAPVAQTIEAYLAKAPQNQAEQAALADKMPASTKVEVLRKLGHLGQQFGDTKAGREAQVLLTELKENEQFLDDARQWNSDREPRKFYQLALNYERAALFYEAAVHYRYFVTAYPDSEQAPWARHRLAALEHYLK